MVQAERPGIVTVYVTTIMIAARPP